MSDITVKIAISSPGINLPSYKTAAAAGMDLSAAEDGVIAPGERKLIPTGISMEIPDGFEGQIRPRSGLAINHGIGMLNAPGTIDSDYRGEVKIILFNSSDTPFTYKCGDRIAQIVFSKIYRASLEPVKELSHTKRGTGGFGSTGI